MKRRVFSCIAAAGGVGGAVLIILGLLFLPGVPADPARSHWWRIIAFGMMMVGSSTLLNIRVRPDYVPEWVVRRVVPAFASFWIILGVIVLALS